MNADSFLNTVKTEKAVRTLKERLEMAALLERAAKILRDENSGIPAIADQDFWRGHSRNN
jgi:hypothetical protein